MSREPSHRQKKLFGWISVLARFTSAQLVIQGWIIPATVLIPLEIAIQLFLILSFDMSTVCGASLVGGIATLPPILLNMIIAHLNTRSLPAASSPLNP